MENYDVVLYNSTKLFGDNNGEHLGLGYIASALRDDGYKVKILDSLVEELTSEMAVEKLKNLNFPILGVSFLSYGWVATKEFITLIRNVKLDVKIIVGGHFASFTYKKILEDMPEIDYILLGEGEISFPALVKSIFNNKKNINSIGGIYSREVVNCKISPITNLDTLTFPARDYLPTVLRKGGKACLSTSRGCYGSCIFCSVQNFYSKYANKKWRYRSAENVVEEIQELYEKYDIDLFDFQDDNFMGLGNSGKERAQKIANLIQGKNIKAKFSFDLRVNDIDSDTLKLWKQVGLEEVLIGVESISEEDLNFYNKRLKPQQILDGIKTLDELGLRYRLGIILFNPFSKIKSINSNLKFMDEINYINPNILQVLNVYEGTKSYEILKEKNILKGNYYNYTWNFQDKVTGEYFETCLKALKKSLFIKKRCKKDSLYISDTLDKLNQKFMLNVSQKFIDQDSYDQLLDEFSNELNFLYNNFC
jgi:radical SAM superfamily enzyme YgiQ (UPF0313 family)